MTNRNPIALACKLENHSFIVPSLGFTDSAAAAHYSTNRDCLTERRVTGMDDNFARVTFGNKTYVPRISSIHGHWLTSELLSAPGPLMQRKWEILRKKGIPMPSADAFNVCLLVDGPRQYCVYYPHTSKHPDFWYSLHMGNRDCFAVWGRSNGEAIGKEHPLDGENRVVAASSGRGVIFARTAHFSNSGEPTGFKTIMIKLEFCVRDKNTSKDDMLKVQTYSHMAVTNIGEPAHDFAKEEDDNGWKILVERAQQGFALYCETVPKEIDNWRKFFIEQKAKFTNDLMTLDGSSYRDRVKKMHWDEALKTVFAPWQLLVTVKTHCDARFNECDRRNSANSTRVEKMLARHKCSPARREELKAMVENFVQPADDNWNFTGD